MGNSIDHIITGRRSIRRYQERVVSQEVLESVITAAIWAPSAHNRQPARFAVITSPEERRGLALAMGSRLRTDLTADKVSQEVIEKDVSRSYSRITGAAVLVLVCLT